MGPPGCSPRSQRERSLRLVLVIRRQGQNLDIFHGAWKVTLTRATCDETCGTVPAKTVGRRKVSFHVPQYTCYQLQYARDARRSH